MPGDDDADGTEPWGLAAVAAVDHDAGDDRDIDAEPEGRDEAAAQGEEKMLSHDEPTHKPEPAPEPEPTPVPTPAPQPELASQPAFEKSSEPEYGQPTGQAVEPGPRQPSPAPLVVKSTLKGPPVVTKDTSLHRCAKEGDVEKLKVVLHTMDTAEIIAAVSALDTDGWTPLHYAAVNSSTACLRELLVAGRGVSEVLDARSKEGQTALHFAVVWECPDHVELLLHAGADVDAVNEFGATPLHWACERGAHDVMRVLLDHSPPANTELVDDCGRTPLHVAAENDMLREAMILVKECGVRVDCRDRRGRTPFELASPDVCQVLQQACGISSTVGPGPTSDRETGSSADLDVEFYEWVSAHGLQAYIGTFRTHAIDLDALKVLDEAHLSEMGIPIGARMKILTGVSPSPVRQL